MRKEYEVTAEFGYETDTYDLTGKKTFEDSKFVDLTESKLEKGMIPFTGDILQTPPKYSAKKVNGKRAYDLARENIEFELKPKQVSVYTFNLLSLEGNTARFLIQCSSGTYIRSLVIDLARGLGTYATCIELRRNSIGDYSVDNAIKMEDITFENIKLNLIKV
jgi:tRNA pseudouridine55 synthase